MAADPRRNPNAVDPSLPSSEEQGQQIVQSVVSNTPWFVIALLLHVLVLAIASIIYIVHERKTENGAITAVTISANTAPPLEVLPPPELIDRSSVPVLPDQEEGIVNPDENFKFDVEPGKEGEITDEVDPTKEAGIFNPDPEALSNLPSGATGGTPIGVGSVGHYSTGVSAYSSRKAGGGGRGGGGLGQGGGGGKGGSKATQALDAALLWLRNHQSADGGWSGDGFEAMCKSEKKGPCGGKGMAINNVGLTGLALLCFLGAGETSTQGSFRNTVKNGLKYLTSKQDTDGCFGPKAGQHFQYNHACAALAMAEAYGMTNLPALRDPAQNGLNFVMKSQNPYQAWRYGVADGDNDSSVTGWMVMALKSGKMSNLIVDDGAIRNALGYIDQMTDPASGRTGYQVRGGLPARQTQLMEKFPSDKSESLTAVGMLVRIFAGKTVGDDPLLAKGADLLLNKLPRWDENSGEIDMYYWYYGSLSMFQVGGRHWDKWNEAMKTAIIDHQHTNASDCNYGSWDPLDPWSEDGGRVYSTAVNCLCMEVYFRYPRVFGMKLDVKDAPKADDPKKGK